MATAQKITRANYPALLVRSAQGRAGTPDGNVFFNTAADTIELITAEESANVTYPLGHPGYTDGLPEANPLTNVDKVQNLALYFFALEEVEKDPTLQGFRTALDAAASRLGLLVGATSYLNDIVLASNTSTTNLTDQDKVADSGFSEFDVNGNTEKVYHGVRSLNPINATTQPYYLLAASLSEADRQAATPIDFTNPGDINDAIETFDSLGADNRNAVLIVCAREFGYTNGEANSLATGVAELGPYAQGYGVGNSVVTEILAINPADVFGGAAVAPYVNMSFFRFALPQTRSGFSSFGAGTSGDFTDELQLSSGTMSITELRAYLDRIGLEDTDQNANTATTGPFLPKRAEPLYTIDAATGRLVTRAGLYVNPASLTAEAQQQITLTNDSGGEHRIPFNTGITIAVSQVWKDDPNSWFRMLYLDAAGGNDYDTANAITVPDASAVDIAGDDLDSRITGLELNLSYAYDTETAGGNVTAGQDQVVVFQIGGTSTSRTRAVQFTITRAANIPVDATTESETN